MEEPGRQNREVGLRMSVKFGLIGAMYPPMDKALESIPRAEKLGWRFIDFPDQMTSTNPSGMLKPPVSASDPGAPTSFFSDVFFGSMEMCAAAAVLTREMEILLAVIDPLRRSPAVMAQEMMTLQHMSNGRMTFAIGAGENKQFEPYGEVRSKPFTRLEEAVHTWIALWESEGKPINRESEFWPLKEAVFPIPMHAAGAPELLFVGAGERIQRLAATVGSGWLTYLPGGSGNDNVMMKALIDNIKERAHDVGRDPQKLRFNAQVCTILADDDDTAWKMARHPNNGWIAIAAASIDSSKTWEKWGYEHPLGDFNWSRDVNVNIVTKEKAEELTAGIPDEVTDFALVWGGPEQVAQRVQEMIDAGINEVSFFNMAASADPEYAVHWDRQISDVIQRLGGKPLNIERPVEVA
jgi:phthiodiolone/phenolphthiodiolone dimycocerosates ketoreductase